MKPAEQMQILSQSEIEQKIEALTPEQKRYLAARLLLEELTPLERYQLISQCRR